MKSIYLIGSLRNIQIPVIANQLEDEGFEVFDSWYSPGPNADTHWKEYEITRGRTYVEALRHHAAQHIFEFDKFHIDRCDMGVMVLPAGRSGFLELGYIIGSGKPGYILLDNGEQDRWDVMLQFATAVCETMDELVAEIRKPRDFSTSRLT